MIERDAAEGHGQYARFSPLETVAEALKAWPDDAAPAPEASGDSFVAIVNAMMDEPALASDDAFDLAELVDAAVAAFAGDAQRKGVTLASDVTGGRYRGEALRVRQLLFNLLAGAVKAAKGDRLTLGAAWADGVLSVRIAGDGVAAAVARGLSVDAPPGPRQPAAQRIAQARVTARALGGALRATDGGVEATIPVARVAAAAEAPAVVAPSIRDEPVFDAIFEATPEAAPLWPLERTFQTEPEFQTEPAFEAPAFTAEPAGRTGLRILVAEQNPAHQQVLSTLLSGLGMDVVVVSDGDEALAAWRQEGWDALLIDIEGAAVGGKSLVRSIRAAEAAARWPRMPMLALAAHARPRDLDEALTGALDGLVAKPIHGAALEDALAAAIESRLATSPAEELRAAGIAFRRL